MIDHERIQTLEEHIFDILAFFEEIDEEIYRTPLYLKFF